MRLIILCLLTLFSTTLAAQSPKHFTSSELFQKIQKLNVLGSVLYIAAHPDDENTRLIAYLSNGKLYRTGYLAMTRGDGGQNLIGDEQGVALGLIRTQELLSARRIDGGEQFFTRAFDFGFSKGPEETFSIWNENKILSDVVWIIRKYQPDILITRFPTTGEGGHGHHTASAILAGEAFDAAGDPSRFPEQLKEGVGIWQPKRLMWNTFDFGGVNTENPSQFHINDGGYNPLLGESYGEIAARSRSQHKTQGFGVAATRGIQLDYFKTIKGEKPAHSLMDGIDITWNRLQHPEITAMIDTIEKDFSFTQPAKSVPQLLELYKKINGLPGSIWRNKKLDEVKQVIIGCSGMFLEAYTRSQYFVPGNDMRVVVSIDNRSESPLTAADVTIMNDHFSWKGSLAEDTTVQDIFDIDLPDDLPVSQPYWLKEPMSKGSYNVKDQQMIGKPENDPITAVVRIRSNDVEFSYPVTIRYKTSDPVKGEIYEPVFIVPAAEIRSLPAVALSKNRMPAVIRTAVKINDPEVKVGSFDEKFPGGVRLVKSGKDSFSFVSSGNVMDSVHFFVKTTAGVFDRYGTTIDYSHIPDIYYLSPAVTRLTGVDLRTSGKTAGYIPGAGDRLPDALAQMGYQTSILSEENITAANLKKFDVVVVGVRAYNIHSWLNAVYPALMTYVRNGGVLFVQYNTNTGIGPLKAKIGPYPFDITRTRVTDEDAPVTFTEPANKLLSFPNKITERDFDGWIQERSTYHAAGFDEHYKALFSMNDPGEHPDSGSLIYCNYGKGRFVYSGLVFFRELPAGNPGAYRLFANLIAKPQ